MIDGVKIIDENPIRDDRGWFMEIFRESTIGRKARQVSVSVVKEGMVKDKDKFHLHKKQWDFFCCIKGHVKLVLVDKRKNGSTEDEIMEILIGEDNPKLIVIPPGVLHAVKGLIGDCYIIDCVTEEYNEQNPDEFRTINTFYDWDK